MGPGDVKATERADNPFELTPFEARLDSKAVRADATTLRVVLFS